MSSVWGENYSADSLAGQFCAVDILYCKYSRVLLPSTWNASVFGHYGMWVGTCAAVMAISDPSMKSWLLAWDLAPKWGGWQQDRSILALTPLLSGDPCRDGGLASWGGGYSSYRTVHMMTSWHCRFITTQMDSDESGGFLLVLVVTNTRQRPRPRGGYCPGTYGQLIELPESCMSRISVSMGVFPTRRMKKSCEMRLAGTARKAGRRRSRRPKRWGWLGYCIRSYSVRATWAFSCRDSTWTGSVSPQASEREAGGCCYSTVWAGYIKSRDEQRGWLKSQQLVW